MSLQFIMGPSGSGKSHYLYELVTTESLKHPERKYIVVVPEQFTMQTQKNLIMRSPHKGILNVEVLSFNRLAHRIFEEVGENRRAVLDDTGKNFVIRKIAGNCESDLKVLGSNLKRPGYISEMKSIISEFTQYDIKSEDLDALLAKCEIHPNLHYKLADVKTVYEGFREYLQEKYITAEEVLDILASVVHKSALLKDSVIVVDDFTGFTPIQMKLLRELLRVCAQMLVTVSMDKRENPYVYKHPYQLFALSKQTVTGLLQIAREVHAEVCEPICLYDTPIYRFKEKEALGFLEEHIFRYTKKQYAGQQDCVQIYCAKNPRAEVEFVARQIRRLIRTKEYRYHDIAVLTNDIEAYANQAEQIFADYGMPIFLDHKRSILQNVLVEYVRSLLTMAEQNFTYESVFRYLRTGLTGISADEIDILENYVIAMGIRGYQRWQETWIRRTCQMEEAGLANVNRIREQLMSKVEPVMEVLKSRHKTVRDVTVALHEFFLQENLQQQMETYRAKFEQDGELILEKEYAQIYRIVIDLLDQFVELLGDEKISMKEYCELLDAGLEEAQVGVIPPTMDQIVVGDVERSRISDVKVIFLMGVNDIYIPGAAAGNGLLSEYDRQRLTEHGAMLAPGAKEKTYIQKFYLYLTLTKPSEQIYLTYSQTSADGTALRPSYLIADVCKLFPDLKVLDAECTLEDAEMTAESGVKFLISGLQQKWNGLSEEWQELYTWYKKNPKWSAKIEKLVEAAFYVKPDSTLTRETARQLYGEILKNSVTRLEQFSACAYAHFLTYGLRLSEREEYQFRTVDLGNLFHSAIEKFSQKLERAGYRWTNLPEEKQEEWIEASVEECITDYGNSILYSSARNTYVIQRLKRMLRRTVWALTRQLEKGDFIPAGYEVSFGEFSGISSSDIELGDLGHMQLRGKIDRIDVCETEDNVYVKIIDYKTGEKAFDLGELCYGLQMQLVIYMNAAVEMEQKKHPDKHVIPAGLFYYRMKDPIVSKVADEAVLQQTILKELRPDGVVQGSAEVLNHMDHNLSGTSEVIPVSRTKSGDLSKTSKVLSEEEFERIGRFAKEQVAQAGTRILSGEADVSPYELGGRTGCDYCPYHAVCGFDERIPGYEYRRLEKLEQAEALQKMRKEADTWE